MAHQRNDMGNSVLRRVGGSLAGELDGMVSTRFFAWRVLYTRATAPIPRQYAPHETNLRVLPGYPIPR